MFRRVILHGGHGEAVKFSDESLADSAVRMPGHELTLVWGSDSHPTVGLGRSHYLPRLHDFFPTVGGSRFYLQTLPPAFGIDPERGTDMDYEAVDTVDLDSPTLRSTMYVSNGYHYTNTVDCGVILSGSIWLIGPQGQECELRAGDAFVDVGAPHAWENRSQSPCTFALFIVGAHGMTT